jgi:hypothetical protein
LRGVASWRSIKGEMATQKHRLVRAARHLWQRRASRAWQGWVSTVAEQGTLVQLLHRGTSGWTQLQMDDGWSRWMGFGKHRSYIGSVVRRGLSMFNARCLARGLSIWCESTDLLRWSDELRQFALVHMIGAELSRSWRRWLLSIVTQARLLRPQPYLAAKKLPIAWTAWHVHLRSRQNLSMATQHLFRRQLRACYTDWMVATQGSIRILQRLSMAAFTNAALARAWRRWVEMVVQYRVVATWMSRHVASSWRRWVEMASERSRQLQLLRKGVVRLLSLEFARCMTTWREAATIEHACGAALSKAAIVVRRLVHLSLSRGWSSWVSGWCEEVRSCELVRQVHQSLMRQSLARAWRRWSDLALSREDQLRALRRGASTLMARRRWRAWVNMACDRSRQQQLLHKGIAFLLSHGLAAWFEATAVAHSHGEALAAAANHFSRRCRTIRRLLCRGWESWLDSWRDTVRTHELRRKVLEYASLKALGAFHSEEVSFPFRFQRRPATTTRTLQNRAVET